MQVGLPLALFCQLVSPQQTAQHKLTLDTNWPPPPLVDLFEDLVAQSQVRQLIVCHTGHAILSKMPHSVSNSVDAPSGIQFAMRLVVAGLAWT